jgi:hypothetical protein
VTTLMMYAGPADEDSPAMRTGGLPLLPVGAEWPMCAECGTPQQFLAHLPLHDGPTLAVFMCADNPGMCDAWSASGGANAVLVAAGDLVPLAAPAGETRLGEVSAVRVVDFDGEYWDALANREVLGQIGGEPEWIQDEETPNCPSCEKEMDFVVQLEEGHDHRTAMNFGSGSAYVFACRPCERGAFLFQC